MESTWQDGGEGKIAVHALRCLVSIASPISHAADAQLRTMRAGSQGGREGAVVCRVVSCRVAAEGWMGRMVRAWVRGRE